MDAEMKAGKSRGPLHTRCNKDNIDTDKMQTTAGSLALEGNFASKDAFVVET
jgi:amidase